MKYSNLDCLKSEIKMNVCITTILFLIFCFKISAQDDSCTIQKEVAKSYALHITEKDRYFTRSLWLGTIFPLAGPLAVETKALVAHVNSINDSGQSITKGICFQDEYVKKVKVERSKEVLKGGLYGTVLSVILYGIIAIFYINSMF
jgi:hypothetical protein